MPLADGRCGDCGSEECLSREVKLLKPAILFLPRVVEASELRPEA